MPLGLPQLFIFSILLLHGLHANAYDVITTHGGAGRIDGLSQRFDFLTGDYHVAWHDRAAGSIEYRRLTPAGVVVTPILSAVDSSADPGETYAVTAVTFDEASRPVVAYTRLAGGIRTIEVARWSGTAWIRTTVVSGVLCNALSLDLFQRQAANWRLAYINFTAPSLRLASSGGGDIPVTEFTASPVDPGVDLFYSANSGSIAWRVPGMALRFGNTADTGSGITSVFNQEATSLAGDTGVQVSRAVNEPGGRPVFVHRDAATSAILLTTRRSDFTWQTEIVATPVSPAAVTAYPVIRYDPEGNPIVAWSEASSGNLKFAARIGGTWYGDSLAISGSLLREPLFLTTLPSGGFHVLAVSQLLANPTFQTLRNFGPIDDFSDADRDAVPVRLERAFVMNTTQSDRNRLPQLGTANIGGVPRVTLTVRQQPGGTELGTYGYEAGGYQMLIQTSRDLTNWAAQSSPLGIADSFTVSGVRFTTYYLQDPPGTVGGYRYLRVRINRL